MGHTIFSDQQEEEDRSRTNSTLVGMYGRSSSTVLLNNSTFRFTPTDDGLMIGRSSIGRRPLRHTRLGFPKKSLSSEIAVPKSRGRQREYLESS